MRSLRHTGGLVPSNVTLTLTMDLPTLVFGALVLVTVQMSYSGERHLKLNRGTAELRSPQFFIIPTGVLASLSPSGWGKLNFSAIPNFQSYMNAWHRIRDFIRDGLANGKRLQPGFGSGVPAKVSWLGTFLPHRKDPSPASLALGMMTRPDAAFLDVMEADLQKSLTIGSWFRNPNQTSIKVRITKMMVRKTKTPVSRLVALSSFCNGFPQSSRCLNASK
jgi:hypothetical protein